MVYKPGWLQMSRQSLAPNRTVAFSTGEVNSYRLVYSSRLLH
jgi:hypothetical protein